MSNPPREFEYFVFTNDDPHRLMADIEKYAGEGWKLQGGISVTSYSHSDKIRFRYAQAMVRDASNT